MRLRGDQVVASVLAVYGGETPGNILNPEVLSRVSPASWRRG